MIFVFRGIRTFKPIGVERSALLRTVSPNMACEDKEKKVKKKKPKVYAKKTGGRSFNIGFNVDDFLFNPNYQVTRIQGL